MRDQNFEQKTEEETSESLKVCSECGGEVIFQYPNYSCLNCGLVKEIEFFNDFEEKRKDISIEVERIRTNGIDKKGKDKSTYKDIVRIIRYVNNFKTHTSEQKCMNLIKVRVLYLINFFHLPEKYVEDILSYIPQITDEMCEKGNFKKLDIIMGITYFKIKNFVKIKDFVNCLISLNSKMNYNKLSRVLSLVVNNMFTKKQTPIIEEKVEVTKKIDYEELYPHKTQHIDRLITIISNSLIEIGEYRLSEIQQKYEVMNNKLFNDVRTFRDEILNNCRIIINKYGYSKLSSNNPKVISSFIILNSLNGCITKSEAVNILGISRVSLNYFEQKIQKN